jgi:hypothetical protein
MKWWNNLDVLLTIVKVNVVLVGIAEVVLILMKTGVWWRMW